MSKIEIASCKLQIANIKSPNETSLLSSFSQEAISEVAQSMASMSFSKSFGSVVGA